MSHLRPLPWAAALLGSLALAGPAVAATPVWTAPAPLNSGAPHGLLGSPSITGNAAGLAVAVSDTGGGAPGDTGPHATASVFTNGVFLSPFDLAPANVAYGPGNGDVAAYATTRLLAAGLDRAPNTTQAVFAFGRLTPNRASLGAPRPLGPSTMHAGPTALAVNAAGDAAMVYPVCRDAACRRALVYLAVRRAGSSTIHSTRLMEGSGPLPRVAAAVDARGDALAVWTQAHRVYARIRTAGGRLRARQTVGSTVAGPNLAPSAALSTHRGELVGWVSQAVGEGDAGPGTTHVAQARDGSAFTGVTLASLPAGTGRYVSGAGIRVAFDPFGRRLVTWTGFEDDRFVVRSGELHGAAARTEADMLDLQTLSDPAVDTVLGDVTTTARGGQLATLVAGARGNDAPTGRTQIQSAERAANTAGAWTRDAVSDGADLAFDPHAAVLPDRAIVVWATAKGEARFSQRIGDPVAG